MGIKYFPVIDMAATGRNISDLRKARGLSVAALQEYFGFDAPQAIYKWQKGQSLPSTDNLYALSYLFGVSIEDILIPIASEKHRRNSMKTPSFCKLTNQICTDPLQTGLKTWRKKGHPCRNDTI